MDIQTNVEGIIESGAIDVYIPDKKFAIFYVDFVKGSDKYIDKRTNKKLIEECREKGITAIEIFEDEWYENKRKITLSKIRHLLGLNNNEKIYARKCTVKELDTPKLTTLKGEFLNKNHIQGNDRSAVKLGLFYEDKLVSVMTFCKPRRSLGEDKVGYDYELMRFASDIDYNVIGGFSKLFKYFERNYEWKKLKTFADKRWSSGDVYMKNGWTHLHDSDLNYWYCTEEGERIHRFSFRKQAIKEKLPSIYDESLTEFQMMDMTNYYRVFDCGNMVFEYVRD